MIENKKISVLKKIKELNENSVQDNIIGDYDYKDEFESQLKEILP